MPLDNIVDFFEYVTGYKPYDYQIKFLQCNDKRLTIRSGRQVGKTTMCAVKVLYEAFWNKNKQILIIAPVRTQSRLLFQMIKDYVERFPEIKKSLSEERGGRNTATEMFFDCGSKIYCLSGAILSKDRIRGFSPDLLVIDEAAFVPDETFMSAEPSVIKTQGTVILVSTPSGKRGFFYESFKTDSGYIKFHVRSEECPLIPKKELERLKLKKSENEYIQEYEGEFTEEGDAYFTRELITNCIADINQIDMPESDRKYFLGIDCARKGLDETVYIIRDDKGFTVKILNDKKQDTTVVIGKIKYLNEIFKFQSINIDDAGTGGAVKDILFREQLPITGYVFSLAGKERMYRNLKVLMEHGRIFFPSHEKLIEQMANLITSYTILGARINPPTPSEHDDYPDALVLAFADMKFMEEEEKEEFFVY